MALGKALEFPFDRGDRVEHTKFGKGRVQQTLGSSGADEKILVRFDSGEERIILAGFLTNVSRKDRAKPTSGRHAPDAGEPEPVAVEGKPAAAGDEEEEPAGEAELGQEAPAAPAAEAETNEEESWT